ncbi:FAD-dependent monooxygenase [Spirosoma rhododendri]|uniref:FAD-binding monooxygenase n=1 Tax=Spirosoma rhododendri TaxID=2728024 RepID=A0A7L5DQK8_9BACT|nr:FAD-dependent monooxygenase [Spirosoma rhododendri]QJD80696.1 FAD-binding monooxygenase [Spirosoma rhododendri]
MESANGKSVLISGSSIAGLSAAYWMNRLGYSVTVIERANEVRTVGGAVDIRDEAVDVAKRMGIFEPLTANRLTVDRVEFKNADDSTAGTMELTAEGESTPGDASPGDVLPGEDIEIERDIFAAILLEQLQGRVTFIFNDSITALAEADDAVLVTFKQGKQQTFNLVLGCDGIHSAVRNCWFGPEAAYSHFLDAYFSISIVKKSLVRPRTMQMYNVPGKAIMLNAYKNKTDIIFCFSSEKEIPYDYRNVEQQRAIILNQFAGGDWRTEALLDEIKQSTNFYFDKFCQIKMPTWTKGRVALIGDAGYCASPAAGMGASLSMIGAATLADALEKHDGDVEAAFQDYNQNLRPFIEQVQARAATNVKENFIPETAEAIHKRNTQTIAF